MRLVPPPVLSGGLSLTTSEWGSYSLGQFLLPYVSPSPVANLSKNFESGLEPALCLNLPSFKLALLKTFHEVLNFVAGVVSSLGPMVQEIFAKVFIARQSFV
jgi:hypothetical protein